MSTTNINSITANDVENRAIRAARLKTNADRAKQVPPLPELSNNKAFLEWILDASVVPSLVAAEAAENADLSAFKSQWRDATDAQRTAALAALTR